MAPMVRTQVDQLAPDVEIWAMNDSHHFLERMDRSFEIHPKDFIEDAANGRGEFTRRVAETHINWLETTTVPVYMGRRYEEFPSSIPYPITEVIEAHCPRDEKGQPYPYFTSTFPYMIALALHEGVDELTLLGADMSSTGEYADERPCVEWWLGYARGRGVSVRVPNTSPVMWGPPYGFMTGSLERVQDMAQKRVDRAKDDYLKSYGQVVDAEAVLREREWIVRHVRPSQEEAKQFFLDRAQKAADELTKRSETLYAQLGLLRDAQHWMATLGFKDIHPGSLPTLRIPRGDEDVAKEQVGEHVNGAGKPVAAGATPLG